MLPSATPVNRRIPINILEGLINRGIVIKASRILGTNVHVQERDEKFETESMILEMWE